MLIQKIQDGGLKFPDITSMIKAIKLMWIKRFINGKNNYTLLAKVNSQITNFEHFCNHKINASHLPAKPTEFYFQIIQYWDDFRRHKNTPNSINKILNEHLWHNQDILIDNKPVIYPLWKEHGVNKHVDM